MSATAVAHQWGAVSGFARRASSAPASPAPRRAPLEVLAGRSKKAKADKKAAKAEKKKAAPAVSKQAKDAARKKAAAAMRDLVSKQGKSYDRIVKELDRDQFREYVLSVRHTPADPDAEPEPVLSDWLPICEVVVADRQQYEAKQFFKANDMDIPETEQQSVSAEQIEGVPAIRAVIPGLGPDVVAMAHAMAGSSVKNAPAHELEFGVEDWGSFENAVDGLEAQASAAVRFASAARVLGVSPDDDPGDIKRAYRKLIATEHPDRNPDASLERFNAIKEAYELLSDRGGQSGATFEGLGDKAKRDFVKLDARAQHVGVSSKDAAGEGRGVDADKLTVALRSLTIYDRIKSVFTARNVALQNAAKGNKAAERGDAQKAAEEAAAEETAKEPVAA